MNFKQLFVLLALSGPLCASANQVDRKQSELDALKQRLQTLQQDFHANQAHQQEAADELRQSERAISSAVIQPGGSIRDDEVIEAADKEGIAMVFTGMRHFRH